MFGLFNMHPHNLNPSRSFPPEPTVTARRFDINRQLAAQPSNYLTIFDHNLPAAFYQLVACLSISPSSVPTMITDDYRAQRSLPHSGCSPNPHQANLHPSAGGVPFNDCNFRQPAINQGRACPVHFHRNFRPCRRLISITPITLAVYSVEFTVDG